MKEFIYHGKSALGYAKEAVDMMMHKWEAKELPPKGHFHYHQGVFLSGVEKTYELCGNEAYYQYIKDWVDSLIQDDGTISSLDPGELDDIQAGILVYFLFYKTGEKKYRDALEKIYHMLQKFPRNNVGGLWHKVKCAEQMWLDGLYMAGPISTQCAKVFQDMKMRDDVVFQAQLMREKTRDTQTGLWYHAWDSIKKQPWADQVTGCSSEFWGRSMGWVPVALLEDTDFFPAEYRGTEIFAEMVKELITTIVKYQDVESGLWYQVLDKGSNEGNWLESSCTCLFVSAICKAVRKGYVDRQYLTYAKKGYQGIIDRLRYDNNGVIIDNICVGTGVCDYRNYCERPTSENDLHGVGAYLLMCTEAHRVLEND